MGQGGWVNLCGSKGAYNRPSYPCHYCTYRGRLLRQGAVDKAKADDQRHAGKRQHHHLQVRRTVGGKQRKIVHDTLPKDIPVQRHPCHWSKRAGGRFSRWHPSRKWISPIALIDQKPHCARAFWATARAVLTACTGRPGAASVPKGGGQPGRVGRQSCGPAQKGGAAGVGGPAGAGYKNAATAPNCYPTAYPRAKEGPG